MKLNTKTLEAIRRELLLTKAQFAEWLGFETQAKNHTRALNSRYQELCYFLDGVNGYSVGMKTLKMVQDKIKRHVGKPGASRAAAARFTARASR